MYYNNTVNNVRMVDTSLVNKILEQGQKLRNAMVGSILRNDPFNTEIIYNKHFNTPKTSSSDIDKCINHVTSVDEKRLKAYIKGEYMTRDEEKLALETLRSMSAPDLCIATERTFNSTCLSSCKCYICEIYNSNNPYCVLRRKYLDSNTNKQYPVSDTTRDIQESYINKNKSFIKYVDSMKVSINSLKLNETGNRKVTDNDKKVPYNFSQTYFLEFQLPDFLVNKCIVSKSKVDSGLENNTTRLCSRRANDSIHFKQVTIHDVKNLDKYNLERCEIKFKISYRMQKDKHASTLGFAKFNLGLFLLSKNLVCGRNLPVFLNENSPIVVGDLKVSLSLGCGRLYFGQEFIEAINSVKRSSFALDSDDSTTQLNKELINYKTALNDNDNVEHINLNTLDGEQNEHIVRKTTPRTRINVPNKKQEIDNALQKSVKQPTAKQSDTDNTKSKQEHKNGKNDINVRVETKIVKPQINESEQQILFGFLYISEAKYLSPPISTYITCRPFCQSETSCSKFVSETSNPVFNFSQLVPLLYEDELLQLLRENYMVIEFWRKVDSTDIAIGLTKISLHQFYLAYRNPVFVKYLAKNKLPIIGTDWWEPIYSVDNPDDILGQVQLLVALGTEEQINSLKTERGFTNNSVRAKFSSTDTQSKCGTKIADKLNIQKPYSAYKLRHQSDVKDFLQLRNENKFRHATDTTTSWDKRRETNVPLSPRLQLKNSYRNFTDKAVNTSLSPRKEIGVTVIEKFDVGTQSNVEMDKMVDKNDKVSPTQEMLGNFLSQLMTQRQKNVFVENGTNTEAMETERSSCSKTLQNAQDDTNLQLRRTTDLLDSLQTALSLDGAPNSKRSIKKPGTFKTNIAINSANHLPSRKKCKSKKSRNKSVKNEDILPSCYVTFETSENDLKITPVVSKSTNPTWNFKCQVNLPEDLLTSTQRRLIFKVWRKSTNTVLSPNMQTDVVIGFAAVDLTVLLAGFPNVQGWFNIIDFTGKCNGQINIHVTPLEDLSKYTARKADCECNTPIGTVKTDCECNAPLDSTKTDAAKAEEEHSEVFSRALKRKFTELDEITQRLRLRLSKVTNDDSDTSSDGVTDEFERDINALCVEEDFDLIDFEKEGKLNLNYNKEIPTSAENSTSKLSTLLSLNEKEVKSKGSSASCIASETKGSTSNTTVSLFENQGSNSAVSGNSSEKEKELLTLDKSLQEGKQKIDALLEKLSLISADTNNTFASRYVSGCSLNNDCSAISIDTEAILKELDHASRPNIQSSLGLDALKFQQLYGGSIDSNSKNSNSTTTGSDTSLITNFSESRAAPDGQGTFSDEKVVKK